MNAFGNRRASARAGAVAGVLCAILFVTAPASGDEAGASPLVVGGYFAPVDDGGEPSGTSRFIRFFAPDRIVRLYVPHPFDREVDVGVIGRAFENIHATTAASAYLRGDFGVLPFDATAHVDRVRIMDGSVLFDCGRAAPCIVVFGEESMTIVSPGIVGSREFPYRFVPD